GRGALGQVHGCIDQISRPGDIAHVKKAVTDERPDVIGQLVADVEPDLGNHGESAVTVMTNVARQGQDATVQRGCRASSRYDHGPAANVDFLGSCAERYAARQAHENVAAAILRPGTELAAVELVAGIKLVCHEQPAAADDRDAR